VHHLRNFVNEEQPGEGADRDENARPHVARGNGAY
jgi:hypothetical protein